MSSSIGFMADNQEILFLALAAIIVLLAIWSAYLHKEMSKIKKNSQILFSGKKASDLEDIILGQVEKLKSLDQSIVSLKDADRLILEKLSRAVQKVGMIRFNPFGEVGGNQSFAVALLDNSDSGVIILSLYSRDGVRVYAKPIEAGKSQYQLSKEEAEALQLAMKK